MAGASEQEDDIGALIWQESQRRKREAAAAATASASIKIRQPKQSSSSAKAIPNVSSKHKVRGVVNTSKKRKRQPDSEDERNKVSLKRITRSAARRTNRAQAVQVPIIEQSRKYTYECSAGGCTNNVQNGGVCIRHGARKLKRRLCSSKGCTSIAKKGGVCYRHGAKRSNHAVVKDVKIKLSVAECA